MRHLFGCCGRQLAPSVGKRWGGTACRNRAAQLLTLQQRLEEEATNGDVSLCAIAEHCEVIALLRTRLFSTSVSNFMCVGYV